MPQVIGFIGGMFGFGLVPGAVGSAAFGAYMGGVAFAGTLVGSLTVKLLTSVALSALQSAMAPSSTGGGLTISTTLYGEQNPETIILGRYATGGQAICPPYSHGKSNRYLTHVIELCSAPGANLDRIMVGDDWVELGTTPHADYGLPVLGDKYEGHIWVKYYDGSQTTADPMMLAKYGAHPDRPWTADMIGAGLCYAILTFYYDQEKLPQVPRYRFEMGGLPVYDMRFDSTAGGSGSQRLTDPETWTASVNAAVLIWNVMHGLPLPGGEIYGGNMADPRLLPQDVWVSQMNRCDAAAPIDGGTEPAYRAGIEARLDQTPADTLEELFKACSATVSDFGYGWGILAGAPQLPVYSFTDDDVIVTKKQEFDPFPGLQDTYNAVTAKFPDPEHYWETKEAPQRINAAWEAQDVFGRRAAALSLPAVPYAAQVQRLMQFWIEDERRFIRHVTTLPPDSAHVDLTDTVTWTSARNGYSAKAFTVHEIVEDPRTGIRQMSIRERDPADWALPPDYLLRQPPAPSPVTTIVSEAEDFGAGEAILYDDDGVARRGGIRLTWSPDIVANGLRWEIRKAGSSTVLVQGNTQNLSAGQVDIYTGLIPGTAYEVRASLIVDRPTIWTDWTAVSAPVVLLSAPDVSTGAISRTVILESTGGPAVSATSAPGDSRGSMVDCAGAFLPFEGSGYIAKNPIRIDISARVYAATAPAKIYFVPQARESGLYWRNLDSLVLKFDHIIPSGMAGSSYEQMVSLTGYLLSGEAPDLWDKVRLMAYVEAASPFSGRSVSTGQILMTLTQINR